MQRSAIRTRARRILKEYTPDFFQDDILNDWIDDGIYDIQRRTRCYEVIATAINTVSGTVEYSNPTTYNSTAIVTLGIKTIYTSNNETMSKGSIDSLDRLACFGNIPQHFAEWGNKFKITPKPTAAYTINPCIFAGTGLSADATDPHISIEYHSLVPLYVSYRGLQRKGDYAGADSLYKEYTVNLENIYQVDNRERESEKEVGSSKAIRAL